MIKSRFLATAILALPLAMTFKEYPPSQVSGTLTVQKAVAMIQHGASGGGKQGDRADFSVMATPLRPSHLLRAARRPSEIAALFVQRSGRPTFPISPEITQ
jgi:hypothetical protein